MFLGDDGYGVGFKGHDNDEVGRARESLPRVLPLLYIV